MTKYKYVGEGAGIPGLPHVITEAEINDLNMDQTAEFNEALEMGLYVKIETVGTQGSASDEGE